MTTEQLLERAREMVEVVAQRAEEAEGMRRLHDETVKELCDAGFVGVLAPAATGGLEMDYATLVGVGRILGRGCASTGWLVVFYGLHNWIAALLPEEGQRELLADRGYMLSPGTFSPGGVGDVVDGGYRVSGRWPWGTGVMHSDWVMVSALVTRDGRPAPRMMVLPIADARVEDVWHTSGMRATGSNDIVVEGAFVPEHRTLGFRGMVEGSTPGGAVHANPLYRWPMVPMLGLGAAAAAVGAAEGALDWYIERSMTRVATYSGERKAELAPTHLRAARLSADVLALGLVYDRAVAELAGVGAAGPPYPMAARARLRYLAGYCVQKAKQIVDEVDGVSGASAQFERSPIQRSMRDLHTLSTHVVFDSDEAGGLYGRALLGVDLPALALV